MKLINLYQYVVIAVLTLSSQFIWASQAKKLLAEDLSVAIKTLDHETRFYHYFGINFQGRKLEETALAKPQERYKLVQQRLSALSQSFWNLNNHTTKLANAGLGLYLAVDPFASSPEAAADTGANFGSVMLELTLNPGTKYLDLIDSVKLRSETMAAIIHETKLTPENIKLLFEGKKKGFYRDTLQYMALPANTEFRKLVLSLFAEKGIAMTEYGWQAATTAFCNTTNGSGRIHHSATVFVGGPQTNHVIKSINMVYWLPTTAKFDEQESESLARNTKLFKLLKNLRPLEKQYQTLYKDKKKNEAKVIYQQMKSMIDKTYSNQDELMEIRSKTMNCI